MLFQEYEEKYEKYEISYRQEKDNLVNYLKNVRNEISIYLYINTCMLFPYYTNIQCFSNLNKNKKSNNRI